MNCACGCPNPARGNSRYASDACRARAWRQRVGYGPQKPLQSRSNGNPRPPRPSDVRVSYRTMVAVLEEEFISLGHDMPFTKARAIVKSALTPSAKQRAREMGL